MKLQLPFLRRSAIFKKFIAISARSPSSVAHLNDLTSLIYLPICTSSSSFQTHRLIYPLSSQARTPKLAMAPGVAIPDYMTDRDAVLKDGNVAWLHGEAPSYKSANTRWEKERWKTHTPGGLEDLVSNLVKNWEKEASFKTDVQQWRTIDPNVYTFTTNGGKTCKAEDIIKLGTYNALIGDSEYYAGSKIDFEESHKLFRTALGNGFSWEVLEVYSGPPKVAFRWRHWGDFDGELRCPMRSGEDLVVPPTNQKVEIFGITVAELNDNWKITSLDTYYDPNQLFDNMMRKVEDALPANHPPVDLGQLKIAVEEENGTRHEAEMKDVREVIGSGHGK